MPRQQQKQEQLKDSVVTGQIMGKIWDWYVLKTCQPLLHQNVFDTKMPGPYKCNCVNIYNIEKYETLSNYLVTIFALQCLDDMFNEPTFVNKSMARSS